MYIGDKSETLLGINGTKARIFRDGKQTAVEILWRDPCCELPLRPSRWVPLRSLATPRDCHEHRPKS